jgi:hypothetical protein
MAHKATSANDPTKSAPRPATDIGEVMAVSCPRTDIEQGIFLSLENWIT